jgi:DNA-binding NarL/FixJ family response regulator
MKILVIEDHALVREGLATTLRGLAADVVVFGVGDIDGAIRQLESQDFDLLTLDLMLPGTQGHNVLPSLRRRFPSTPVLVLSAQDDGETIGKVMAAGASGFVSKSASAEEFMAAVRIVLNGEIYLAPEHQQLLERIDGNVSPVHSLARRHGLTAAQVRVLEILVAGQSNRQIAQVLGLSEGTVKIHVSAILKALHVTNRAEAVLLATRKRR